MKYNKVKTFSSLKDMIKGVKMDVTEWEIIFAKNTTKIIKTCDLHHICMCVHMHTHVHVCTHTHTHTLLQVNCKYIANPIDK